MSPQLNNVNNPDRVQRFVSTRGHTEELCTASGQVDHRIDVSVAVCPKRRA